VRRRDLHLTTQQQLHQTDIHDPGGIRIHDLSRGAALDRGLRRRGHWDRHSKTLQICIYYLTVESKPILEFDVLRAVYMNDTVTWDMTKGKLIEMYRIFGGTR